MKLKETFYAITHEKIDAALTGFRIACFSDIHDGTSRDVRQELLEKLRAFRPDAILIPGDTVRKKSFSLPGTAGFREAEALLTELAESWPVYCSPGNHERRFREDGDGSAYAAYLERLRAAGVIWLENSYAYTAGGRLRITGLDIPDRFYVQKEARLTEARMAELNPLRGRGVYDILLAHSPRYFDAYAAWGADLTLSGHLHGGMIRLPLLGGLLSPHKELLPDCTLGRYYRRGGRQMIVTAGICRDLFRFNNPRELVLLELQGRNG